MTIVSIFGGEDERGRPETQISSDALETPAAGPDRGGSGVEAVRRAGAARRLPDAA